MRRPFVVVAGKWGGPLVRVVGVKESEFEEFYRDGRDRCLRAVLAVVGDRDLAEDLVAEAFSRAWVSWRKIGGYEAPHAWVVRTALNTRITWWRRRRREVALEGHDVAETAGPGEGVDPGLLAVLARLPKRQREVLALRVFLDLDTETTGRVLGIAAGTVTAHLHRAVTTLRSEFAMKEESAG